MVIGLRACLNSIFKLQMFDLAAIGSFFEP